MSNPVNRLLPDLTALCAAAGWACPGIQIDSNSDTNKDKNTYKNTDTNTETAAAAGRACPCCYTICIADSKVYLVAKKI